MKSVKLNIIFNFSLKLLFLFSLTHLAGFDTKSCSAQNLKEGAGAYKTGNYRNLFKEIGRSEKEIDARIEKNIDYAHFDGKPVETPWNKRSNTFAYDSWRTHSNWSFDWSWWQKDPRQVELSNRIQNFFASFGVNDFGHHFTQDGQVLNAQHRKGLVATTAVASLAANHDVAKDFVQEFWNTPVPESHGERYYDGTLYLMSLLHCSGKFKIWKPE